MKVTRWWKKLSAAIVAAGIAVPGAAYAANIPLGDPNFDDYTVPAAVGYAYASDPSGAYRPTSAWVANPDSPPGYTEDSSPSNWLYNTAYGESSATHRRAAPRSGDQAMHGYGYYNGQETNAVFEADTTYTFSIWAQGDIDSTDSSSRVFLYFYDGANPFSEASSLIFQRYAPDTLDFNNRGPRMTTAQSQANWRQISLSYTVAPGAPEIGHPVGVAFWIAADGAVEDATLTSTPIPEPTTMILVGMGGLSLVALRRRR